MSQLIADRAQLRLFHATLFRHASPDGFIAFRSFYHDPLQTMPLLVRWMRCDAPVIDAAVRHATATANCASPAVFCPPIATFKTDQSAAADNLLEALVLSAECDAHPFEGRIGLGNLLGPPTLAMASGGVWENPETGEIEDKLHLHWRLSRAATTPEEHAKAHRARRLLVRCAGGVDPSGAPSVHPMRWAGSWHCKDPTHPRLATIVAQSEVEVELDEALERLEFFVASHGVDIDAPAPDGNPEKVARNPADLAVWMSVIPNPHPDIAPEDRERHWGWWNNIGMALWAASNGSAEGLRLFIEWSLRNPAYATPDEPDKVEARWRKYFKYPPKHLGAGTLYHHFDEYLRQAGFRDEAALAAEYERQGDDHVD